MTIVPLPYNESDGQRHQPLGNASESHPRRSINGTCAAIRSGTENASGSTFRMALLSGHSPLILLSTHHSDSNRPTGHGLRTPQKLICLFCGSMFNKILFAYLGVERHRFGCVICYCPGCPWWVDHRKYPSIVQAAKSSIMNFRPS